MKNSQSHHYICIYIIIYIYQMTLNYELGQHRIPLSLCRLIYVGPPLGQRRIPNVILCWLIYVGPTSGQHRIPNIILCWLIYVGPTLGQRRMSNVILTPNLHRYTYVEPTLDQRYFSNSSF